MSRWIAPVEPYTSSGPSFVCKVNIAPDAPPGEYTILLKQTCFAKSDNTRACADYTGKIIVRCADGCTDCAGACDPTDPCGVTLADLRVSVDVFTGASHPRACPSMERGNLRKLREAVNNFVDGGCDCSE